MIGGARLLQPGFLKGDLRKLVFGSVSGIQTLVPEWADTSADFTTVLSLLALPVAAVNSGWHLVNVPVTKSTKARVSTSTLLLVTQAQKCQSASRLYAHRCNGCTTTQQHVSVIAFEKTGITTKG